MALADQLAQAHFVAGQLAQAHFVAVQLEQAHSAARWEERCMLLESLRKQSHETILVSLINYQDNQEAQTQTISSSKVLQSYELFWC